MNDRLLDQHFSQWAAQNALSTDRADAIRRAILAAPSPTTEALPSAWWHQFSHSLALTLQKSAYRSPFPPFFSPLRIPAVP
jgi:hypothetical protein